MTKRGGKYTNSDLREGIKHPGQGQTWPVERPQGPSPRLAIREAGRRICRR
jgi:hypothetical protein